MLHLRYSLGYVNREGLMKRLAPLSALVGVAGMLLLAGCGLDVTITGGSAPVCAGATQHLQVKLANVSACPLAPGNIGPFLAVIPNVPAAEIENEPEFELLCGIGPPPARLPSNDLARPADVPLDELRTKVLALAQGGDAGTGGAAGTAVADQVSCSAPGVFCTSEGDGAFCDLPPFAVGQMLTLDCAAKVPASTPGKVYNLAFTLLEANGVCKAGDGQGTPCIGADDCGMAGVCGDGICKGGGNNSFGCDTATATADCPDGGTCVLCDTNLGLGAACEAGLVTACAAPVPAAGPGGLVFLLLGLAGVAFIRLRRGRSS
jgi:hypothetical protein